MCPASRSISACRAGRAPCAGRPDGSVCAAREGVCSEARFDAQRVARVAEALRQGRFQIDAEAIADRLLARPGLLTGRPPH
jgi:hypothetical protein